MHSGRLAGRNIVFGIIIAVVLAVYAIPARAEHPVWATGRILDIYDRPMSGALVTVYDDNNRVIDYARTDEHGDYALAVPKNALHLQERHSPGFFAEVFGGVTRFVGGGVDFVANPLRAGVHAVTAAEAALNPDIVTKGGIAVAGAIVDKTLFAVSPRHKKPIDPELRKMPGALMIKVIAPDRNDLVGITHVYWLQRENYKAHGKQSNNLAAWLDPVQLTSVSSEKPSSIQSTYLNFTSARIEPSLAEPGQTVRVSARLLIPSDPVIHTIVMARDLESGKMWELHPTGNGRYEAEFTVDKRFARNDHHVTIVSYPASELRPGRRPEVEKALESVGVWDSRRPYVYNPLLVVSRNRAELILTVLGSDKHKRD